MPTVSSALSDLLGIRKWVQADLARVLGWPVQTVSELMQAKRRLDPGMALDLAQLTPERPAEDWLALQAAQDIQDVLRKAGQVQRLEEIAVRASAEDLVPVRELVRHGQLPLADPATQFAAARELLGDDPTFCVEAIDVHGELIRFLGNDAHGSPLTCPLPSQCEHALAGRFPRWSGSLEFLEPAVANRGGPIPSE